MAMGQRRAGASDPLPDEAPDAEWLKLTEGMDAYERFRFIARHVLAAAVEEVQAYVKDERIFSGLDDQAAIEDHLAEIDQALREDSSLSPMERRFLCAAVAEAMADHDMEAACPWQDLVRIAAAGRDDPEDGHPSEL